MPPAETTLVIREGVEKACLALTERLAPRGFARTRKMFWTRAGPGGVDVVHLHRAGASYGAPGNSSVSFRVHFARWPAEATDGPLNGPHSDLPQAARYHLRFNAKSGSTYERCLDDLVRFFAEVGEPWFAARVA